MLNKIWFSIISVSVIYAIFNGTLSSVSTSFLVACEDTVNLCITFLGVCSFWLGMMEIIKKSSLIDKLSKLFSPIINLLFKKITNNKKAIEAITLNITANFLGLGNAATPFGIKAIKEMNTGNNNKNKLTNEMIMFLVLNTTALQLVPTTIITYRLSYGSKNPAIVFLPILCATFFSTFMGIIITKILLKRNKI